MTVLSSQSDSTRQSCVVKLHCKTFKADIRPEAVTSVFAGTAEAVDFFGKEFAAVQIVDSFNGEAPEK